MATSPPSQHKRILLFTNVERGESNVFLATSHALINADPNVELHFASFGGVEAVVTSVCQQARRTVPNAKPISFHKIGGLSMNEGLQQYFMREKIPCRDGYLPQSFLAPLGTAATIRAIRDTIPLFVPYEGKQFLEVFSSVVEIIKDVNADLVVVDSLMAPALTACYHLGVKFACLSPNAIKEFAAPVQPRAAGLWKYPALFSGFAYPIPWHLLPVNIYFSLYVAFRFHNDPHRRAVESILASHGGVTLRTPIDLLRNRPAALKILVSTLPAMDFPVVIPSHVFPCGPILRHASPIEDSDPQLLQWLLGGPTIYINLGSICLIAEDQAVEMARALTTVLEKASRTLEMSRLRVMWKLKKRGNYDILKPESLLHGILGEAIRADSVRIVDWVLTEPISILKTGHVACSVHHGGANSFNEAVIAGVPQVVLPQWTDCYDYAQRVEMLGIGRWGSRTYKPRWSADELSRELSHVLFGGTAAQTLENAKKTANICWEHGAGAEHAAQILLEECDAPVWEKPLGKE